MKRKTELFEILDSTELLLPTEQYTDAIYVAPYTELIIYCNVTAVPSGSANLYIEIETCTNLSDETPNWSSHSSFDTIFSIDGVKGYSKGVTVIGNWVRLKYYRTENGTPWIFTMQGVGKT